MDSFVLLANEEDMLHIMHDYGIQALFEILNFQKYAKESSPSESGVVYHSFMGDAKINEKVTIILNQIIACLGNDNIGTLEVNQEEGQAEQSKQSEEKKEEQAE